MSKYKAITAVLEYLKLITFAPVDAAMEQVEIYPPVEGIV